VKPFEVLKEIVACGYLKPDFAPRHLITVGGTNNTIKGPHPAVCFSEQPLWAYLISANTLSRYERYGLAIHKWALYEYGARPVIYGDEQTLGRLLRLDEGGYEEGKEIYTGGLPVDEQYRWARFDPIPQEFHGGGEYPIDFTHEREWRARVLTKEVLGLGRPPSEGIPIFLPRDTWRVPTKFRRPDLPVFVFFVWRSEKRSELREFIQALPSYEGTNRFLRAYFAAVTEAPILVLEEVQSHLDAGEGDWGRIETIPSDELRR